MKVTDLKKKLAKLLGDVVVYQSGAAIPELLNLAAIEIFYNCNNDNDQGQTTYMVLVAMMNLRRDGYLNDEFDL